MLAELRNLYDDGRYEKAVELYTSQTRPAEPEWHLYGSLAHYRLRDACKASSAISKAMQMKPQGETRAKVLFQYGECQRRAGDTILAIGAFEKCLRIMGGTDIEKTLRGPSLFNYALALSSANRYHEAFDASLAAADEFKRRSRHDLQCQALQNAAWFATEIGRLEDADAILTMALPLAQQYNLMPSQHIATAYTHALEDRFSLALGEIEQLTKDDLTDYTTSALSVAVAAIVHLRGGDIERANSLSERARDLVSKDGWDTRAWHFVFRLNSRIASTMWLLKSE